MPAKKHGVRKDTTYEERLAQTIGIIEMIEELRIGVILRDNPELSETEARRRFWKEIRMEKDRERCGLQTQ